MGTTRIKVIDLSSDQQEIKTSRKHAEKLAGPKKIEKEGKLKTEKVEKAQEAEVAQNSVTQEIPEKEEVEKVIVPKKAAPKTTPSTHHIGHKYQNAKKILEKKEYSPKEALEILPKISYTKFDPTVEIHLNVIEKNIRGAVNFPHPVNVKKEKKILVFSDQHLAQDNLLVSKAGKRIIWGDEKTITEIETGKLKPSRDFDNVFATAKYMPQLAKVAKVLGPSGLMPNPKNGTIINNLKDVVTKGQDGLYEYKSDPQSPTIHAKLGKLSANSQDLEENLKALILSIGPAKIKKAFLKSTMSPSIKINLTNFGK